MQPISIVSLCLIVFCVLPQPLFAAATAPATISRAALEHYSKWQQWLAAAKAGDKSSAGQGTLISQVNNAWGPRADQFTADQITAATKPRSEKVIDYEAFKRDNLAGRRDAVPVDQISAQDAVQLMDEYAFVNRKSAAVLRKALADKYGDWNPNAPQHVNWYEAAEITDVEDNGAEKKRKEPVRWASVKPPTPMSRGVAEAQKESRNRPIPFWEHFKTPLIRQNWRDVLYDEDPSQSPTGDPNAPRDKKLPDLVGATFSYAHNGRSGSDTWTAIGALIEPLRWKGTLPDGKHPVTISAFAIAPSVSIDRVDSNDAATKEVDALAARLGIYAEAAFRDLPVGSPIRTPVVQVRAAGVYATDTGGHARQPGAEGDIELRTRGLLTLGHDIPLDERGILDCQLRAWLHLEGGDVQDNGATWDTSKGEFFRVGPSVQYQLNAPHLAFNRDVSLTALYTYLAAIKGNDRHNSFLKVNLVFDIYKDTNLNHKISLNLAYQRGGLDFTKQGVDVFTAGLGVLF